MFKSFKINLFLLHFKLVFILFKLFPLQKKTTFVTDYGVNVTYVASQVDLQTNEDIIILKSEDCLEEFDEDRFRVIIFSSKKLVSYLKSIFHLATSRYIIVDSDFLFLAGTPLRPGAKCIQLWHSTGSVKNFGYMRRTLPQYNKVFDNMDYIVTGSPLMTQFYKEAFNERKDDVFIKSGIPRTDFFFNDTHRAEIKKQLEKEFPLIKEKHVILYAPTYREYELDQFKFEEHLDKMHKELRSDYVIFLSLHPKDDMVYKNKYPGFIYNVTSYPNINEIAIVSDLLVTDYSSLLFEYALLHKPMIFYAFDLETFKKNRGLTIDYENFVPGPVVKTNTELIKRIKENNFDLERVKDFSKQWNQYSAGHSSENLVNFLYNN